MKGDRIEPGISPRTAGTFVDRLEAKARELDEIARAISRAYDAECHRVYGYDFCRPLPNGADSKEALRSARAQWDVAVAAFALPDVAAIDAEFRAADDARDRALRLAGEAIPVKRVPDEAVALRVVGGGK
jgi:hypothetical protein